MSARPVPEFPSPLRKAGDDGMAQSTVTRSHAELDLVNQAEVQAFFGEERIDQVYLAAAKVGGIHANDTYPAEFIYVNLMIECNVIHAAHRDDMAAASVHVMNLPVETYQAHTRPMLSHINVGTGVDCTIRELAETLARVTGFTGRLAFDATKPDGTPRKLMDVSRLKALGWQAQIGLEDGLRETYAWFLANQDGYRQA